MRRITESKWISLPPIVLYINDIEELCSSITSLEKCEIKFKSSNNEFDTLEEVKANNKEEINNLEINSWEPTLFIQIKRFQGIRLYTPNNNEKEKALFLMAKEFLLHKTFFLWGFFKPVVFLFISLLLLPIISLFSLFKIPNNILIMMLCLMGISLFLGLIFWLPYLFGSKIYLYPKNQKKSFFKRNFDQIMLLVFGAVIGILFTKIFEKIFSLIKK